MAPGQSSSVTKKSLILPTCRELSGIYGRSKFSTPLGGPNVLISRKKSSKVASPAIPNVSVRRGDYELTESRASKHRRRPFAKAAPVVNSHARAWSKQMTATAACESCTARAPTSAAGFARVKDDRVNGSFRLSDRCSLGDRSSFVAPPTASARAGERTRRQARDVGSLSGR
jgi:hypothetical protein